MTYAVNATVNNNVIAKNKMFKDENTAKKYIYNLMDKYSCEVDEEYFVDDRHEFVCDRYTRFVIQTM